MSQRTQKRTGSGDNSSLAKKRVRLSHDPDPVHAKDNSGPRKEQSRKKIRKLAPSRPFPIVPTSVSATGPRSAHREGKNKICITRKTSLGAYMRRCKQVVVSDGYKALYLSAMGAAIPHLVQLSLALPPILPYGAEDVETEIITGTHQVHDEVIPEDEEEDIAYQSRNKSTLMIIIKIQGGDETQGPRIGIKNQPEDPIEEPEQLDE